ncbi:MAG: FprA family A-type flavoprotein [Sedimentisphaerales bacterium]|nr:FprA family A-type flavoprotein [Sedimentisphaerales bacterium]
MNSIEVKKGIYWVGSVDWNVRDFHGYTTSRGSSYNAYLIVDEKIALIDSVKHGFRQDMLAKIAEHVDPSKIDYVISNHTEPDHSGELLAVMQQAPQSQLIASAKGEKGLRQYYPGDYPCRVVKTGDTLNLGRYELSFINTPMLHWPDSMFTYLASEKLLFSMDAFGQHLASNQRFDVDVDFDILMHEAKTYYANIIMHLGSIVAKTLKAASELAIETVCPSHGVIWTKHLPDIISRYQDWCAFKPAGKVLVIYDSMWHSTEMMAEQIVAGATEEGVQAQLIRLPNHDLTNVVTEILDADAVVVGSPTLNNGMMPTVAAFLTYIKGLKPAKKIGFAFGSHGWSGGGAAQVGQEMEATGIEIVREPIVCQYRPDQAVLDQCLSAGKELAQHAKSC